MIRLLCIAAVLAAPAVANPVFEDRISALPVQHIYSGGWEHFVGGGVAVFDCNGDTRPDIAAAGGASPARLFVNTTPEPGAAFQFRMGEFAELVDVTGIYPADIDSDGRLDLVLLRVGPNILLKGNGSCGFREASNDWGFHAGDAWTTAFSATWEAGQTWPTLAIGNYVDRDDPEGPFGACAPNELHRPGPEGYSAPLGIEPGYCALSMLLSDWRRTGVPELRISNDRHYYLSGGHEEMWRLSPLAPRTEADGWNRVSLWGMGIASGDVDADGWPDVMLTSMGDQLLQFNRAGKLQNAPFAQGTYAQRPFLGDDGRPSTGWHAEFGDIDNDGRLDLFIAKGNVDQMPSNAMEDPNNLLVQRPDGTFSEVAESAGVASVTRSRGAAMADFDGDGRLDLVVVNRRAPMELWQNTTQDTGNWVRVELRQNARNTRGIGAWIEVRTKAGVQAREVTVGGGHAGGQAGPVHFGLGPASTAEVRVRWPGADWSDWKMFDANQTLTLRPDVVPPG
ncbi:MAG: CRTAC1 family protein [Pseudomonadota bacterium]